MLQHFNQMTLIALSIKFSTTLKGNPIKVSYLTQCVKDYSSITLQRIVCHYIALRPYLGNQDPNNRPRSVTTLTQVPDSFIVLWVSKEHFQSIDPILFSLLIWN